MDKLTAAQKRLLEEIRSTYAERLEKNRSFFKSCVETEENADLVEKFKMHLERTEKGYMVNKTYNIKTLEKLAACGYIEIIKDECRKVPVDWVKLL